MSDSEKSMSDIEALASKAQAMLERVRASAESLDSPTSATAPSIEDTSGEPDGDVVSEELPAPETAEAVEISELDVDDELVATEDEVATGDSDADIDTVEEVEADTAGDDQDIEVEEVDSDTDEKVAVPEEADTADAIEDVEADDVEVEEVDSDTDEKVAVPEEADTADAIEDVEIEAETPAVDTDLSEQAVESSEDAFEGVTPLITGNGESGVETAWPSLETQLPESLDDSPVESIEVHDIAEEVEDITEETAPKIEDLPVDESNTPELVDDEPVGIPRADGEEPSIGGLGLDEEGSFDDLEFRDIMDPEDSESAVSEAEFAAAFDSVDAADLSDGSTANTTVVPVSSVDGVDDESSDLRASEVAASQRRRHPLLLLLIVIPLAILVLFGDQIFDRAANDAAEVETGITEPEAPDATETPTTEPTITEATTTVAPTTSEAPATTQTPTTVAQAQTAWDLLGEASNTNNFVSLASGFGLQELLEGGSEFTVFAPSNAALAALTPEQLGVLSADADTAANLIDYHIIDGRLTTAELREGGSFTTRSGLPIEITGDGDSVVVNGTTQLPEALESAAGNVFVISNVLEAPSVNEALNLGNIQFETLSNRITPVGIAELDRAVAFFQENPDANALIEGHTDTDGSPDGNQRLSDRRAQAVLDYLVSQGVDGSRLEAQGFGETEPIIVDGVEDKEASRRIEIVLR